MKITLTGAGGILDFFVALWLFFIPHKEEFSILDAGVGRMVICANFWLGRYWVSGISAKIAFRDLLAEEIGRCLKEGGEERKKLLKASRLVSAQS